MICPGEARCDVKGSKFLATCLPAPTAGAWDGALRAWCARHPRADHHTFALRLQNGVDRMSDGGEPSGTAGAPIMHILKEHRLLRAGIIVTRYFGGVKLGRGGLFRAYGSAALLAVEQACLGRLKAQRRVRLELPYGAVGKVENLNRKGGVAVFTTRWGAACTMEVTVEEDRLEAYLAALSGILRGEGACKVDEAPFTGPVPAGGAYPKAASPWYDYKIR